MCKHIQKIFMCGHAIIIVSEWCLRYQNSLQSSMRCPPNVCYQIQEESLCFWRYGFRGNG
ncbi:hypothetical protein M9X92_012191 [Pyricularia oryzae]|nr:hypothetical protein M9X92_012191 [Pyricularia oryzae]